MSIAYPTDADGKNKPLPARDRRRSRALLDTRFGRAALQTLAVVFVFAAWQVAASIGLVSAFLVGAPDGILRDLVSGIADGSLFYDTWITLYEAILGFAIGTVIGSTLASACGPRSSWRGSPNPSSSR